MDEDREHLADAEMADASSSDSESSDSDFHEVDISAEDAKVLENFERQLQENPGLYDSHVQYIEVLRRCKMRERLREARQAMHAQFPLTEALWFDWLSDEIDGVAEAEDIARIERLFDAAVQDYLSISLWVQYLEFVRDFNAEVQEKGEAGRAKMRSLCERALTAGGLHVTEGSRLWAVYRSWEAALLEEMEAGGAAAEAGEEAGQQAGRLRALWLRQLQVPLADGPQTLAAYEAWERSREQRWELPESVRKEAWKAQKGVQLRQAYEEALAAGRPADAELLAAYMAYIKVEQAQGDPARVQCLYERALAMFPVTHYLWAQYCRYLEAHIKSQAVVGPAYARALRNCPWVGQLWARALRALERSAAASTAEGEGEAAQRMPAEQEQQHAALYQRALAAGLQGYEDYLEVVLARADCLRRQGHSAAAALRETLSSAAQLLQGYYPEAVDRTFRLPAYWAECEARLARDMPGAREVWEALLKTPAGRLADTWAAYIEFERRHGNVREERALYRRCYSRRLEEGGQAVLCEAWLRFEREEGSAEDHFQACLKVEPILAELQAEAAAAADAAQAEAAAAAAEKARKLRQQNDPNFGKKQQKQQQQKKPKGAAQQQGRAQPRQEADAEEPAGAAGQPEQRQQEQQQGKKQPRGEQEAKAMPPPPAKKARKEAATAEPAAEPAAAAAARQAEQHPAAGGTPAGREQEQQQGAHEEGEGDQARHGGLRQQRRTSPTTAFVKHLADDVDEAALRQLLEPCGRIASLELGRDRATGRSKGFAFVQFADEAGLAKACQLDRQQFHGKHIFVAPSKPPAAAGGGASAGAGAGQQQQQQQQGSGARGVARGGGRGGRGAGGRGIAGAGRGPRGHERARLDLGGDTAEQGAPPKTGSATAFMPRSAALHSKQASGGSSAGGSEAPKSNAQFRDMFLKK